MNNTKIEDLGLPDTVLALIKTPLLEEDFIIGTELMIALVGKEEIINILDKDYPGYLYHSTTLVLGEYFKFEISDKYNLVVGSCAYWLTLK